MEGKKCCMEKKKSYCFEWRLVLGRRRVTVAVICRKPPPDVSVLNYRSQRIHMHKISNAIRQNMYKLLNIFNHALNVNIIHAG